MRLRQPSDGVHDAYEMRQDIMRIARARLEGKAYQLPAPARVHGSSP